ncbi:hypothetical protein WN48_04357 [Eufriesea mexicana]|nr:hypothetical protein WN48_04357 [Eufriesea mexicana]
MILKITTRKGKFKLGLVFLLETSREVERSEKLKKKAVCSGRRAKTNSRIKALQRRRKKCEEGVMRRGGTHSYTLAPSESSLHANGFIHTRI